MLSERKKKILCAVIDSYIESAEPVSSKEIQERCLQDCSSATIRNELSALESMGYLYQPHISAGRVPTDKAYRMYVDELMHEKPVANQDIDDIDKFFGDSLNGIEDIAPYIAKVISHITNYTSVVVKEDLSDRIQAIKLLDLTNGKMLLVIVTDAKIIKDGIVDIPEGFTETMMQSAEDWLNTLFVGKHISEFLNFNYPYQLANSEFNQFNALFKKMIDVLRSVSLKNGFDIVTNGESKIFDYEEYKDIELAKELLATLEHKDRLAEIFTDCDTETDGDKIIVKIGSDSQYMPDGCSAVVTKININDNVSGNIGIIGPKRMDYKKVTEMLNRVSELISEILK